MLDQIWIEYNGFLAEVGRQQDVSDACIHYLSNQISGWDELVMGAIREEEAARYARVTGLDTHLRWKAPCYGVDLGALEQTGDKYLDTLSRNTRYQINRCHRLYRQSGNVELVRPDSLAKALALFDRIGPQHMQRWGSELGQSGFANSEFVRFHREFIREHWENGGVDLVCLVTGDREIASFYNLVYKQTVYFYLGATVEETDNRLKPGLLGHSLCVEDYRHRGFRYYDFMGGYERYKSNLGKLHGHLVEVSLQQDRCKLRIERLARRTKNCWLDNAGGGDGR